MSDSQTAGVGQEKTLGELVATASRDVSALVRAEIELAKMEVTDDLRRAGVGAGLFAGAAFLANLIIILLSIALALGLRSAGLWDWAAFLVVAGFYLLVAGILVLVGVRRIKGMPGVRRTRETLRDDLALLRREPTERPATG